MISQFRWTAHPITTAAQAAPRIPSANILPRACTGKSFGRTGVEDMGAGGKIEYPMKISVGADHAGFALKEHIREVLVRAGHDVSDLGTHSTESTDYPDYAAAVGRAVANGTAERGILVCASGVGMSMAANKINGIRAALGTNPEEVAFTRHHNNANVLTLGARYTDEAAADELVRIFLETGFDGGRHERRVEKISLLERK